jgi:hypothetical protein
MAGSFAAPDVAGIAAIDDQTLLDRQEGDSVFYSQFNTICDLVAISAQTDAAFHFYDMMMDSFLISFVHDKAIIKQPGASSLFQKHFSSAWLVPAKAEESFSREYQREEEPL